MTVVGSQKFQAGSDNYKFTVDGNDYAAVKVTNNGTYVITPKAGATITGATVYATTNKDDDTECTITSGDNSINLVKRTKGSITPASLSLSTNAEGNYSFTVSGTQSIVVLDVTYDMAENIDVKVSSAGYATLFYDKKLEIPEGVTAYTGTINGESVTLTELEDVIPANTGVILAAAEGTYNFIVTDATAPTIGTNVLTGTTTNTAVEANTVYTLGQNSEGVVGLRLYSGTSIRAYSAYATSISGARFFSLEFGGETTGINNSISRVNTDNQYYNLAGQRVANPTRGLYIVNGKKVVVK